MRTLFHVIVALVFVSAICAADVNAHDEIEAPTQANDAPPVVFDKSFRSPEFSPELEFEDSYEGTAAEDQAAAPNCMTSSLCELKFPPFSPPCSGCNDCRKRRAFGGKKRGTSEAGAKQQCLNTNRRTEVNEKAAEGPKKALAEKNEKTKHCRKPEELPVSQLGHSDIFRGYYDVQGCGKCNDYCRWVGGSGSGGDPHMQTSNGGAYWSCAMGIGLAERSFGSPSATAGKRAGRSSAGKRAGRSSARRRRSVQTNTDPIHTAGIRYAKAFQGECNGDTRDILMYEGNGDNKGTRAQKTKRCAWACGTKNIKKPLRRKDSWKGFKALGFIVSRKGRCFCESAGSNTCTRYRTPNYDRYDFIGRYAKAFRGECKGGEIRMYEGNGDNEGTRAQKTKRCAWACQTKKPPLTGSWTDFKALGFIVSPKGRCYCESSDSHTCERYWTLNYNRYDFEGAKLEFIATKRTWTDAEADCVTKGGHLASIMSAAKNSAVTALCKGQAYCWIGGIKNVGVNAPTAGSAANVGWKWSDGKAPVYTNFERRNGGQRVNVPGQPYTFLRPSSGQWQFDPNNNRYAYVCELGEEEELSQQLGLKIEDSQANPAILSSFKIKRMVKKMNMVVVAQRGTSGCNWPCYLNRYPDLQKALGRRNVVQAEKHYYRYGKKEGRNCKCDKAKGATASLIAANGQSDFTYIKCGNKGDWTPAACKPANPNNVEMGADDAFRGWYDIQGCGLCNDYCRWIGQSGSGGDPAADTDYHKSTWVCSLAGTENKYGGKSYHGQRFQNSRGQHYQKCPGKGAMRPVQCSVDTGDYSWPCPTGFKTTITAGGTEEEELDEEEDKDVQGSASRRLLGGGRRRKNSPSAPPVKSGPKVLCKAPSGFTACGGPKEFDFTSYDWNQKKDWARRCGATWPCSCSRSFGAQGCPVGWTLHKPDIHSRESAKTWYCTPPSWTQWAAVAARHQADAGVWDRWEKDEGCKKFTGLCSSSGGLARCVVYGVAPSANRALLTMRRDFAARCTAPWPCRL